VGEGCRADVVVTWSARPRKNEKGEVSRHDGDSRAGEVGDAACSASLGAVVRGVGIDVNDDLR